MANANRDALRVVALQAGPVKGPRSTEVFDQLDAYLATTPADVVVLSELATTPYFPTSRRFDPATIARIDGDEVARARAIASQRDCVIALSIALEFAPRIAHSAVLLVGPDGPIEGRLVSGPDAGRGSHAYAKVHLSQNHSAEPAVNEKYHFRPGDGFLVWDIGAWRVAPIVCYDRSFADSWRTLAEAGTDVVLLPIATTRPERVRMLEAEIAVGAMHHGMYVVAACKAGTETWAGATTTYSGGSMIVGPDGTVLTRTADGAGVGIAATLERTALDQYPATFHYARDRRPIAYGAQREPEARRSQKEEQHG